MKSIDILLPYWGDPALAIETVESILSQSNDSWSLIISDDNYHDKSFQSYIQSLSDDRITYIRQKTNLGITKNFNFLLSKVKAEYCTFIGCDDRLLPEYVSTALSEIGEADFYQPGVEIINDEGSVYLPIADRIKKVLQPRPGMHSGERLAASLCHGNWLYFPSILWKSSVINKHKFDEDYKIVEDLDLELTLIAKGYILAVGRNITFQYRRSLKSLSSTEKKNGGVRFREEVTVYNKHSQRFNEQGWRYAAISAKLRITSRLHSLVNVIS